MAALVSAGGAAVAVWLTRSLSRSLGAEPRELAVRTQIARGGAEIGLRSEEQAAEFRHAVERMRMLACAGQRNADRAQQPRAGW